jgi:hypothetical protein
MIPVVVTERYCTCVAVVLYEHNCASIKCIAGNRTWPYRLPQSQKQCIVNIGRTAVV